VKKELGNNYGGFMGTYRNEELGFEIDFPVHWPKPEFVIPDCVRITSLPNFQFNIIVGPMDAERILEYTEAEFRQYSKKQNYTDLIIGRIRVNNKDHVWAKYNMGHDNWTKKYMITFGGIEYAVTCTCYSRENYLIYETIWDDIVVTLKPLQWRVEEFEYHKSRREAIAGKLYEKAYEASTIGNYNEACNLLNECLKEDPNNILAHKELAFILKNIGKYSEALPHRLKVKELNPSDKVNLYNLAMLYFILERKKEAIEEINALCQKAPNDQRYLQTRQYFLEH
jgi:tetratricopeptide (TPR) repeat protein